MAHLSESYPLSPMQLGMLYHGLREDHAGVDIEQILCSLREPLNVRAFQRAWEQVVARHPILRSNFRWEDVPEPVQEVQPAVPLSFREMDWRGIAPTDQEARLKELLKEDRGTDFDFTRAPLMRFTLIRFSESAYRFLWTFHHALLDGRSFPIVLQEVFACYEANCRGEAANLVPLPRPYRDHIEWLRRQDSNRSEAYWQKLLHGFTTPTPFSVDQYFSRTDEKKYQESEFQLSARETQMLNRWAQSHELTMNTLLQAAWAILLSRYSGEHDVVFGGTRAGRSGGLPEADSMVGLFINTLPLRVDADPEKRLLPWLQKLRAQWMAMREHEYTPLARVQSLSAVPPGSSLFDSIVVFENFLLNSRLRALGGAWMNREFTYFGQTNFPLTVMGYLDKKLVVRLGYDGRRFADATVERMLSHLRTLLLGMPAHETGCLHQLPMLSAAEREELLAWSRRDGAPTAAMKGSATARLPRDGAATLATLFEAQAARTPQAVALTYEDQRLTYAQLDAQANGLAHYLRALGVGPDVLVGLSLERSVELVVAVLAILKAGGAYLPIDLAYPKDRLAFMLDDAQAPILITQTRLADNLPATQAKVICLDDPAEATHWTSRADPPAPLAGPDHLAYVIYTSGTTGQPKGSLITNRNVARLFAITEPWYGFDERDVWTLFHSYAFDFSVWEIWGALLYGGRLVIVPYLTSRSPEAFYELLTAERVTVLNQTPSAFRQLMQAEENVGPKNLALRHVIFGGEALEMAGLRPWFERHGDQRPQLTNMYGITETTVHVTYRPLSQDDLRGGSVIGAPLPDLQICLLDPNHQPAPIGVPGEIYVGGAGLARGYLRRPELTAQRFIPHPFSDVPGARLYKTGDLGRRRPDGDLEYLGRLDQQVKIRGFRIEPGEIETVLCQHPQIRQAVVLAREDTPGIKRLVAYLVPRSPVPEIRALRTHLQQKLPDYMVPAAYMFLDQLPLTPNGKIDRLALPEPEPPRPASDQPITAPRTPAEKKLAAIWARVLRLPEVSTRDNFFELGGDSILSIQIISLARQAGLALTPTLLFQNQTIAELAAACPSERAAHGEQGLVRGTAPLTPVQRWFFEQQLAEPHYFNQSFLFVVNEPLDAARLQRTLLELERHHDALRLRVRDASGELEFGPLSERIAFEKVNVAKVAEADLPTVIEQHCATAQASLSFTDGSLWRVVYFDLGAHRPGRLMIAIHHLAVDGVSWRFLLEDLEAVYRQLGQGQPVQLPAKSTSFKQWAGKLAEHAPSEIVLREADYWRSVTEDMTTLLPVDFAASGENTEASARTITARLDPVATRNLLQNAPAAYNTQINDLLLTALAQAFARWTERPVLFANLEGHGREDFDGIDLSRTVGWFTTIFPVRLELPANDAGEAIKSIKEQLRKIPRRGFGYGLLRYLSPNVPLAGQPEPQVVFNYLGQFDQVVAGSKLFTFAPEGVGPWHSPRQTRRHVLEINSLVVNGCLEMNWSYSQSLHRSETIQRVADDFLSALRNLIAHCLSPEAGGFTPSDFPLARLDQPALDRLATGIPDIEDIYPLSPMQTLFFTAGSRSGVAAFDQWRCRLRGDLNVAAFQRAWEETVKRHPILRSTFHAEGLREPLQTVHRGVKLPWTTEDWRESSASEQAARWETFLAADRARPIPLTEPPLMRFVLARLGAKEWRFVWSVPALLLDGWSWPLVFRDVGRSYDAFCSQQTPSLDPSLPYRNYLDWLGRQNPAKAEEFWRETLKGFFEPTPLPSETPVANDERHVELSVTVSTAATESLQALARRLQITLNTVVQGAWALCLSRQSGRNDVVFGAAFSGRPTDLPGVESMVGPFVNNLPVRVTVDEAATMSDFLKQLHGRLLELNSFQFLPLVEIQRCSDVPWRHRLFDSLVVFQNYVVDDSARRLGERVEMADFNGPLHTNFPVMLVIVPGSSLRLSLIYDSQVVAATAAERWLRDLTALLEKLPDLQGQRVTDAQALLSPPVAVAPSRRRLQVQSQNFVPPQTEMEKTIASLWQQLLALDKVGVEDNFFELGGHSLALIQLHNRLCTALGTELPIVKLFEYPTIRSLAGHLVQPAGVGSAQIDVRERAQRQKKALARLRAAVPKQP